MRNKNSIPIVQHRTAFYQNHMEYNGTKFYNALPNTLKGEVSLRKFEKTLKELLLDKCLYSVNNFCEA